MSSTQQSWSDEQAADCHNHNAASPCIARGNKRHYIHGTYADSPVHPILLHLHYLHSIEIGDEL